MPSAKRLPSTRPATRADSARGAPVAALAEAAWVEADAALAEALVETSRALAAKTDKAREEALEFLSQALARAARRRGFSRIGKSGALETFDPARHELGPGAKRSSRQVRVLEEGVARGREVLIKARVTAARAKRK